MNYVVECNFKPKKSPGLWKNLQRSLWQKVRNEVFVSGTAPNMIMNRFLPGVMEEESLVGDLSVPHVEQRLLHAFDKLVDCAFVQKYVNATRARLV